MITGRVGRCSEEEARAGDIVSFVTLSRCERLAPLLEELGQLCGLTL